MLEKINKIIKSVKYYKKLEEKENILKQYINDNDLIKFLEYCYSPYKNYNITKNDLIKNSDLNELEFYNNIFELCDILNTNKLTYKKAIAHINGFISQNMQYQELLLDFFDRNLKLNLSITEINKIFHNIIPVFNLPEIEKYDLSYKLDEKYCIERKLSGVHVLTFIKYNNGKLIFNFISADNKEFFTLNKLKEELTEAYLKSLYKGKDIVIEGNVCTIEKDNFEDWNKIKTDIIKKNFTIMHPKYICYDILLLEEFQGKKQSMNYDVRYRNLKQFMSIINKKFKTITYIFAAPYNESNLKLLKTTYLDSERWDGLILRKFTPYKTDIKLLEYNPYNIGIAEVKQIETSIQKIISKDNNVQENIGIKNLIVYFNCIEICISNGITEEQRKLWYQNKDLIIGKKISFKYQIDENNQIIKPKLIAIFDSKKIKK